MRVVLADLKSAEGLVSKDTVVGGYGSRSKSFTRVTGVLSQIKWRFQVALSVQMAELAAIAAASGHEVVFTRGEFADGDVAVVLSSLVDYRHETAWADAMRARGIRTGFVGLAASKLPHLFAGHADLVISGEPEDAFIRLIHGERLAGVCPSREVADLDSLPFPRWDLLATADTCLRRVDSRDVSNRVLATDTCFDRARALWLALLGTDTANRAQKRYCIYKRTYGEHCLPPIRQERHRFERSLRPQPDSPTSVSRLRLPRY
jgi:hypothetical protein